MIEGIHDEQQRLVVIDLEALIDGPFQLDRIALHFGRFDGVRDFAVGAEQPAAVDLQIRRGRASARIRW